jgi:putative ABC transport system permease protein
MMSINSLALKSLRYRKHTLILSVVSIALSVILLLGVERIRNQVHESFSSTISGTDLIVGSRTGNISLLLSSVFHLGYVNQNVSYETYEKLSSYPQVAWTIPLSLGDSHKGYAVLGTTDEYFEHFLYGRKQNLQAKEGNLCVHHMGAVLGAAVAKDLGYQLGDQVVVTHGMGEESFVEHEHDPFTVSGILKPTGTPVDQTIHVSIFAMGSIHDHFYNHGNNQIDPLAAALSELENESEGDHHHEHGDHDYSSHLHDHSDHDHGHTEHQHDHSGHHHDHSMEEAPETLTAFMLGLKNRTGVLSLQRALNTYKEEPLTAIMPAVTLTELWGVVKPIEKALLIISFLVLIVAFAGMLTTIMTSLNERRREMAILRSVGAKSKHIFKLIMLEAFGVTLLGMITGVVALYILILFIEPIIEARFGIIISLQWFTSSELIMLGIILLGGLLIGIWPAYRSYKNSLADGLIVKH